VQAHGLPARKREGKQKVTGVSAAGKGQ